MKTNHGKLMESSAHTQDGRQAMNPHISAPDQSSLQFPDDGLKVFVYGTLQPGECNYPLYCDGHVTKQYRAIAYGTLFDLPFGYPAMADGHHPVYGTVLHLDEMTTLQALDDLEDYDPTRPPAENEYIRKQVEVFDLQGHSQGHAWVYVMDMDKALAMGGRVLPQGIWSSCAYPHL